MESDEPFEINMEFPEEKVHIVFQAGIPTHLSTFAL